jgi:hypothetical protein
MYVHWESKNKGVKNIIIKDSMNGIFKPGLIQRLFDQTKNSSLLFLLKIITALKKAKVLLSLFFENTP